jgi:hypothetical protein
MSEKDEVLVRVDSVGKKFCRSLKKSLWYGVCDIGAELNPFRRRGAEGDSRSKMEDRVGEGERHSVILKNVGVNSGGALGAGPLDSGHSSLDSSSGLRPGEFWAVKDVSFELRRGGMPGADWA